jgi:DnaK suppressor protein
LRFGAAPGELFSASLYRPAAAGIIARSAEASKEVEERRMPGKKSAAKPAKAKKSVPVAARKAAPPAPAKKAIVTKPKPTPAAPPARKPAASTPAAAPAAAASAAPAARAAAAKPAAPAAAKPAAAAAKPAAPVTGAPAGRTPPRSIDTGPIATYVQRRPPMPVAQPTDADDGDDSSLLAGPRNVSPYIAKRGEQYMNKGQLEHFRQILQSWKRDLMEEVDRTVSHMKDEAANFPDPNDRATQEEEFSLELRTRDRERKLIRKIEEALKRIEDGSYGYCLETGEEIGIKRLEARPVATLSIEAQERRERREKQYGDRDDRYR